MSSGKHTTYVVKIFEKEVQDYGEAIKYAINKQLMGKAHVNNVEKKDKEEQGE